MPGPIVYVDTSEVREGRLDDLRAAVADLARFVEENEPDLVAYDVYFDEDGRRMTVVHVHRDARSLRFHMEVAGPRFAPFAELLDLVSIDVYGDPGEDVTEQLLKKATSLGSGAVRVHRWHAGFGPR